MADDKFTMTSAKHQSATTLEATAGITPTPRHQQLPDHADLRRRTERLQRPSADLIREERDER